MGVEGDDQYDERGDDDGNARRKGRRR